MTEFDLFNEKPRAYGSECEDCKVVVSVPRDARPLMEKRLCMDCYRRRWDEKGRPSDPRTGEIVMYEDGKRLRWSTPVRQYETRPVVPVQG